MIPLHALYQVVAVVLGLVVGSFWNVAIARLPRDKSLLPRSRCPACGTPVRAADNVPVVSWILLRGRCRACSWPIPATYPLTELLGGLTGFLIYRRFVPEPSAVDLPHLMAAALFLVFGSGLAIGAFVDIRDRILPDQVTLFLIPIGLVGAALLQALGYTGWLSLGWREASLGVLAGAAFFGGVSLAAYASTGVEALGMGDVKLLAMIGAFTGPPGVFVVAFGASFAQAVLSLTATIVTQQRMYLPFGPTLCLWAFGYVLYGDVFLDAWFPMFARLYLDTGSP